MMGQVWLAPSAALVLLAACATADVPEAQHQQFTGWLFYHHEMMLFETREDYVAFRENHCIAGQECRNPVCISGIFVA